MQACNEFLNEFKRNTKSAGRKADIKDVEDEFLDWFFSPASDGCLEPARIIVLECSGLTE